MGGYKSDGSNSTLIEFVTISTLGDAATFGGLFESKHNIASASNAVRAIGAGGSPSTVDTIQFITMSSFGSSIEETEDSATTSDANLCMEAAKISLALSSAVESISFSASL